MAKVLKKVSKISGIYGQPGEEKVSAVLEELLPDDYVILNSPRISYHGATIDIDHVVIGPNGIFAIESKNMHGKITGGLMGNWNQERKRTGKHRRVKIGNPANQVNHYAKILKSYMIVRYLNEVGNKVNVKIYPVVAFVHEEAELDELDYTRNGYIGRVRILKLDELIDFIKSREGVSYTSEDINHFAEILVPNEQRDQTEYYETGFLDAQKNDIVKRYEFYEEVGRGNFGTVYRGFDIKLDREVAIKKMHHKQKDDDAIRRFFREAQINAKLNHENIVSIFDYYEDDGDYYLIMEFVDGPTLEDHLKDREMSLDEVYEIVDAICAALENAHENNVVHRDLKPANILLTTDFKVKVSDFGIARLTEDASLTKTSAGLGTPTVMSPEQISRKTVDARTDVFGVGVLLYLLLTGKYPFSGEHLGELVHKILYLEPEPLRKIRPDIPLPVEELISKCLEKEPKKRIQSITKLRKALYCTMIERRSYCPESDIGNASKNKILRRLPIKLRKFISSDRHLLRAVTTVTLILIVFLLSYQGYVDSKKAATAYLQTKQYGFTNENLKALYANPEKFKGVPVNIVGKIGKVIKLTENTTIFNVIVSGQNNQVETIIVEYRVPHFMLQVSDYIKVVGSVQSDPGLAGQDKTPVIIADKVEALADPWSILAPPKLTIHPNAVADKNGKMVRINRVEFADKETRLFITVANLSDKKSYFVLSKPIARQGNRVFDEIPNRYGIYSQPTLELLPGEYIEEVIFLNPLDPDVGSAKLLFGSDLNLAANEKPYFIELEW